LEPTAFYTPHYPSISCLLVVKGLRIGHIVAGMSSSLRLMVFCSASLHRSTSIRVHWPRIKLLAIESTSAQNKEDCQEQTASLLNKEDKVQADSQVKKLLAALTVIFWNKGCWSF
jgi:hypothetical protein